VLRPLRLPFGHHQPAAGTYQVRPFHESYVRQLQTIVKDTLGEFYEASLFTNLHNTWPEGQLLAISENRVVGFVVSMISYEKRARILLFGVEPSWRGKGVARGMMDTFINRCRGLHFEDVTLEVRISNARAIKFYQRYGMAIVDPLPHYYPDGEDGYLMWLSLKTA
jgi:ribosomal protein S18 acetylase RimI-like enzyme